MSEQQDQPSVQPSQSELTTVSMYDRIPQVFSRHMSTFRSCIPDIELAHELAGVPLSQSRVVEIGCGDGRHAEEAFVPSSASYNGYDPSKGLLEIARLRFVAGPADMFREGYAETTDYPEETDIIMAVNSILHVPKNHLADMYSRVAAGLRRGGVFYAITKVEEKDNTEVHHDNFDGVTGERIFYHHSSDTLSRLAGQAGLLLAFQEQSANNSKPWDWYTFAVTKSA